MIDLEPATISEIVKRGEHVVIVLPGQVAYGEEKEERPTSLPLMHCELLLRDGIMGSELPSFPFAAETISLEYEGGSRRLFVPLGFRANGPARVYAELESDYVLLAEGSSIELHIVRESGRIEVTYGPDQ